MSRGAGSGGYHTDLDLRFLPTVVLPVTGHSGVIAAGAPPTGGAPHQQLRPYLSAGYAHHPPWLCYHQKATVVLSQRGHHPQGVLPTSCHAPISGLRCITTVPLICTGHGSIIAAGRHPLWGAPLYINHHSPARNTGLCCTSYCGTDLHRPR